MYRPDVPFPVYERAQWWQTDWDALEFAQAWNPKQSFFRQLAQLAGKVPRFSIYHSASSENSSYSNFTLDIRNCYLSFSITLSEDCLYCAIADNSRDCLDCLNIDRCELLYQCVDCRECYHCIFLDRCVACSDCFFCTDCLSCRDCFGCCNLQGAQYCWFNEKLSPADYAQKLQELNLSSASTLDELSKLCRQAAQTYPKRFAQLINSADCSGDHLANCKNTRECFDVHECEDVAYITRAYGTNDSYDCYGMSGKELLYEVMSGRGNKVAFAHCSYDNSNCYYIMDCFNSRNLFGCVGLNHKEYCILNRAYDRKEYEELVPKIIGQMLEHKEWGEFFPSWLSPFGYQETIAQEYFPLTQQTALELGFNWSNYLAPKPKAARTVAASEISIPISEAPDDITDWAILCEISAKPFRISKQELEFYRRNNLPLPHLHPDQRHRQRLARRNPRQLWARQCGQCGVDILTSYAPQRPEKVYCEQCYQKEVF